MAKPYYRWPPGLKASIMERDGYKCRIQLPPCTTRATVLDHIIPVKRGGAWFDPDNLRAACQECNQARRRTHPHPAPRTTTTPERW